MREIVSRRVEGDIHRYTYARRGARARARWPMRWIGWAWRSATASATLAWNGYRHLELYFGVSGSGRVLHTINPRLAPDQVAWIANHAEDQVLCFDMTFLPIVKAIWSKCTTVKHWIALCDADKLPADSGIPGLLSYEAWIGAESDRYAWPEFDEKQRGRAVLHQRHHRQPQGRALQPPLDHAARLWRGAARRDEPVGARQRPAGGADVPRQRLGHPVRGGDDRRQAGVSRRRRWTASRSTS